MNPHTFAHRQLNTILHSLIILALLLSNLLISPSATLRASPSTLMVGPAPTRAAPEPLNKDGATETQATRGGINQSNPPGAALNWPPDLTGPENLSSLQPAAPRAALSEISPVSAAVVQASTAGAWTLTGSMNTAHAYHTAVLLKDGRVLVAGGCDSTIYCTNGIAATELYDPATGQWSITGNMNTPRVWYDYMPIVFPNGKVLVTGGENDRVPLNTAEVYNPSTGTWTLTSNMNFARTAHRNVLLNNGKVLVVGGSDYAGHSLNSAELYDPVNDTWTLTGSIHNPLIDPSLTLLSDGKVLLAGGRMPGYLNVAEIYDPDTGTWSLTGNMNGPRSTHTANFLPNGKVLVVGGYSGEGSNPSLASAELYDPATGTWSVTGSMATGRHAHTATLLPNNQVLVIGGCNPPGSPTEFFTSTEGYDWTTGDWTVSSNLNVARAAHTATRLQDGKILVAGGATASTAFASAELYDPGILFAMRVLPPNASLAVAPSANISVTFNRPISPTTVTSRTFTVRGNQTGDYAGAYTVLSNTVTFDPARNFRPGEEIAVNLSSGIRSTDGITLTPYTWQFQAAVLGGTGIFTDSGQRLSSANTADVKLGDLDGDGDLDAFIGNVWTHIPNEVWFNDGLGHFNDSGQRLGNATTESVALGDLDGDGDLDVFAASTNFEPHEVWLNDGTGHFSDSGQRLGNSYYSTFVALGDVDGDGDLDAFIGNGAGSYEQPNQVWLNDGTGNFTDSGQRLGSSTTYDVALGDLDGDGDLDAFIANIGLGYSGAPNEIWLNDGVGVFADSGQRLGNSARGASQKFLGYT